MRYWNNYIRILFFIIIGLTSISKTQAQITNNEDDSAAYFASHALKYYQKDSFNLAFNFCNRALILYGADARSSSIASIYQLKGYMYLSRGAHAKAIESFSRANYIGEELGSKEIKNHQDLGDEANALLIFEKLDAYKDSLYKVNEIKKYEGPVAQLLNTITPNNQTTIGQEVPIKVIIINYVTGVISNVHLQYIMIS